MAASPPIRQRYIGKFSLSKDTPAQEVLQCFALSYFAVTPQNERSIEGLTNALCELSYDKYFKYISLPKIDSKVQGTERPIILDSTSLINHKLNALNKSVNEAREAIKKIGKEGAQRKKKGLSRFDKALKRRRDEKIKIIKDKPKELKKILNEVIRVKSDVRTGIFGRYADKLYQFSSENKAAVSWVESAYWIAESLGKILDGEYKDYIFVHSTSPFARKIKEVPLTVIAGVSAEMLGIDTLQSDMFQPADIYLLKKSKLRSIMKEYYNVMVKNYINNNNDPNFEISHTPLLSVIRDQIKNGSCLPISLKKGLSKNPPVKFIGSTYGSKKIHEPLIDSYTRAIDLLVNRTDNLQEIINKFVEVKSVEYKHSTETFNVNFSLNYSNLENEISKKIKKKVELSDEFYKLTTASMTWNALPTDKNGKTIGAYTGGAGFTQVSQILKKYPQTKYMFSKITECRKKAFSYALNTSGVGVENVTYPGILNKPQIINSRSDREYIYRSILNHLKKHSQDYKDKTQYNQITLAKNTYAKYLIALNSQLLYGRDDKTEMSKIEKMMLDFGKTADHAKIRSLLPKDLLETFGWVGKTPKKMEPGPDITRNQKQRVQLYSRIQYQAERASKLEALYFYTEGKGESKDGNYTIDNAYINDFYKRRISLTIYGLITKKGGKIFLNSSEVEIMEKETKNKNISKISDALGFRTMPHFLVGNQ